MALVLKTSPVALAYGQLPVGSFSIPPYQDAAVGPDQEVFWFTSETQGGHGLVARGWIVSAEADPAQSGKIACQVAFDRFGPTEPLSKDNFASLARTGYGSELQELNGLLYLHSHNKIAVIGDDVADFLRNRFE